MSLDYDKGMRVNLYELMHGGGGSTPVYEIETHDIETFLNGWQSGGTGDNLKARYGKTSYGIGFLGGTVKSPNTISYSDPIFNIPEGFRPNVTTWGLAISNQRQDGERAIYNVRINTDGNVYIENFDLLYTPNAQYKPNVRLYIGMQYLLAN